MVIGGTGLIGTKLVKNLRALGHEVVAASPSSGVNTVTGEGLATALAGAHLVIDVANSPSFADKPVMEFFEKSTGNLLAAETAAGVGHHIALSVVGTERLLASGYFRAKITQEKLIAASNIHYTILRATQFFEFTAAIAAGATEGQTVRLPAALMQPIGSDDVAAELARVALEAPARVTKLVLGCTSHGGPAAIPPDADVLAAFAGGNKGGAEATVRRLLALNFAPKFLEEHAALFDELVTYGLANRMTPAGFQGQLAAVGVALAFNYIGLVGSIATPGARDPLNTEARIRNSHVVAKKVAVTADSSATIDATTVAAAVAVGAASGNATAVSAGGVYAHNVIDASTTVMTKPISFPR